MPTDLEFAGSLRRRRIAQIILPDIYWGRPDEADNCDDRAQKRALAQADEITALFHEDGLRQALIRIARMIPGVICEDGVSEEFLVQIPEELSHYDLVKSSPSVQFDVDESEGWTDREHRRQDEINRRPDPTDETPFLLGCPWCGEQPVVQDISASYRPDDAPQWNVGCYNDLCAIGADLTMTDRAHAIEAWNSRQGQSVPDRSSRERVARAIMLEDVGSDHYAIHGDTSWSMWLPEADAAIRVMEKHL